MILRRLRLTDFRNYRSLDLEFGEKSNLILGANASGKSNLAEAVYFLSLARSWRSREDKDLIRQGAEAAYIRADIVEGDLHREIVIELSAEGRRIYLNGKPLRRLSELSRLTNVLLFTPDDVGLFAGPPGDRRDFLDISLSKRSSDYLALLSKHGALLKSRNALLKSGARDRALLEVITHQLIEVSEPIVNYRTMYVTALNSILPSLLASLRGETVPCGLVYRPFVRGDGDFPHRAEKAFVDALEGDIAHGATSVGIHREDFSFRYGGKDIARFGSQGENRMAALALKIAPYFLVEEEAKKPICVLDDVTSELDVQNQGRLFSLLERLGQSFLTATDLSLQGTSVYEVADHNAKRRN